jgi:hypothetical protein
MVGAAVLSLVLTVQPFRDSDVWWHLAMGRYILAHGIPQAEQFSFLHAANPWVGQQWLYEIGLARAVALGGPGLVSLLMGLVGSSALLIATLSIPPDRRPPGPWLAAGMLLSTLVAAQVLGVRGQVISLFFAAVLLQVLMRWRRGSMRVLLLLPPIFVVWANLHAGFVIGLAIGVVALLAVQGVDRRARRLLGATIAASALATLINPAGPALWAYVGSTFANPTITGAITEWQSPDFHNWWVRAFEAEALLLVAAWVLAPRRAAFDMALAAVAFAASLQAQRNVSLFAIVAAPQIALYGWEAWRAQGAGLLSRRRRPSGARGAPPWFGAGALLAVVAGSALGVLPQLTAASTNRFEATNEPLAAVDYVTTHLSGHRLYSIDMWGGYIAERIPRGRVVYLYGETAVFGNAALQQYLDIHDLRPDWTSVVSAAGITDAVLPEGAQEVSALVTLGWTVDCRDRASASVVMSAPAPSTPPADPAGTPATIVSAPACA